MIICQDLSHGNNNNCVCLSTHKNEYRRYGRYIRAPVYTIDVEAGLIIPGRALEGRGRLHRQTQPSVGATNLVDAVFKGLSTPPGYRYLSFNEASSVWMERQDQISGYRMDTIGARIGEIHLDCISMSVEGTKIDIYDAWGRHDTLCDILFGGVRHDIIVEARSLMTEMISSIVINGFYTDKQPEIYGSEEADLI